MQDDAEYKPTQPAVDPVQPPQPPIQPVQQQPIAPSPPPPSPQPVVQEEPQKPRKKEGGIFSFIVTLVAAFILVQAINMFFFQSYKVFGSSMVPTLHDGDRLIISKVGKTGASLRGKDYEPKRGDVVVFVDPQREDLQLIKRVIGLPGERVVLKDGKLTVYNDENPNGFNPDEAEYGKDLPPSSGEKDVVVPERHLFVSGDNRAGSNSLDSRNELGTIPEELVVGTLKLRIWPLSDAEFF